MTFGYHFYMRGSNNAGEVHEKNLTAQTAEDAHDLFVEEFPDDVVSIVHPLFGYQWDEEEP